MQFVFYSSLKPSARRALNAGNGKHGRFAVDGDYIAVIDKDTGRPKNWVKVIRSVQGQAICEVTR